MMLRFAAPAGAIAILIACTAGCATQEELALAASRHRDVQTGSNLPARETGDPNVTTVSGKDAAEALRNRNTQPVNKTGG
jgi:hypothetical protein